MEKEENSRRFRRKKLVNILSHYHTREHLSSTTPQIPCTVDMLTGYNSKVYGLPREWETVDMSTVWPRSYIDP